MTPQSGPLAAFAEADNFVIDTMAKLIGDGLDIGGTTVPVEIVVRDSQSNPNRRPAQRHAGAPPREMRSGA